MGLQLGVELPLGSLQGLVLQGNVGQRLHDIGQLLLGTTSLPVGVLQLSLGLLELVCGGMVVPLSLDQALPGLVPHVLLLLKTHFQIRGSSSPQITQYCSAIWLQY